LSIVVTSDAVESWRAGLEDLFACFAGRFSRVEPRRYAFAYLQGLLAQLERKNGWTLAEASGFRSPNGLQDFLQSPAWDPDLVRDDVRDYVVEHLGDPDGVLIADETGFLKKGVRSAGVQRQYSGTAGRTENCQIGTFLCYASAKGRALIDRELYVPVSWTDDRPRCRAAAIPDEVEFATKPRQARRRCCIKPLRAGGTAESP
jgi:SRSO17 transposase